MLQSWLRVPQSVAKLANGTLGRVLHTPSPPDLQKPMGATLEIQRTLYMEQMEQQLMQSRLAAFHQPPSFVKMCFINVWGGGNALSAIFM